MLNDEIVGTEVSLEILLNKSLKLRNEDKIIQLNNYVVVKEVGTATVDTEVFYLLFKN